ncbi:MAG: asparagine--tRNA ligase [Candidatus Woesearchaeota archaeon]
MVEFTSVKEAMRRGEGEVALRGWVYRERGSKKLKFIVLRDSTNIIQCVVSKDVVGDGKFELADKIQIEASMKIWGTIKRDERAPSGYEVQVRDFEIVGESDQFPITKDQSVELLMDKRHLSIRTRRLTAILKIRSTMLFAFHEHLHEHGYTEAQAPTFNAATSEGGSSTFRVDYFGQDAFLTQSWQFYAENFIHAFEDVYALAPSFRAEKSSTNRHLTEFWHLEVESAWKDMSDILSVAEGCILHAIKRILEKHETELEVLGVDTAPWKKIEAPFPRIPYDEAIKTLQEKGFRIEYGDDFGAPEERELAKPYGVPIAVTNYPLEILKFYHGEDPDKPGTGMNFNVLAPGLGEIVDGSQRESDLEEIERRLEKDGVDLGDSDWYLDSRRYGSVPHAGFGLGTERVLQWLLGLEHIRDALPFPRFMNRIRP